MTGGDVRDMMTFLSVQTGPFAKESNNNLHSSLVSLQRLYNAFTTRFALTAFSGTLKFGNLSRGRNGGKYEVWVMSLS